jgi:parallel beta-helix repeat protein
VNRRIPAISIVLGLMLASVVRAAPAIAATTIEVFPGDSIQSAVNQASPGDTILVHAGTYKQSISIKTDDLTIQGEGASDSGTVLKPSKSANQCQKGKSGICANGGSTSDGTVTGLRITGLKLTGFDQSGILLTETRGAVVSGVLIGSNKGSGIAASASSGTRIVNSSVKLNDGPGIFIADSPSAHATIRGNEITGNAFGIFLRDSAVGDVAGNTVEHNCAGIAVLNTTEKVTTHGYDVHGNTVDDNTRYCPASKGLPATSGLGIAVAGAHSITVRRNTIEGNRPSRSVPAHAGVLLASFGKLAPKDDHIVRNHLRGNQPNIEYDGTGTGNVIGHNTCTPSC